MSKHRIYIALFGLMALLGLAACAKVAGGPDGIVIEHAANQVGFADAKAERHCGAYGKRAVRVRTGAAQTSALLVQSRISEYSCVAN